MTQWLHISRRPTLLCVGLLVLCACSKPEGTPIFSVDLDATGPLSVAELSINYQDNSISDFSSTQRACVTKELGERVATAGDPVLLDPTTVEFIPEETWPELDAQGKRMILAQVIVTKALFVCG